MEDDDPLKAIFEAAAHDRVDVVARLLDGGVPVNVEDGHGQRPLHAAAANDARRVAVLLIERGADVDAREKRWDATALGYSAHGGHHAMSALLSAVSRDVWHLSLDGHVVRLREVLATEPERAREVMADGTTPLFCLPNDDAQAVEVADLLIAHGADVSRIANGKTAAAYARERGLDAAAAAIDAAAGRSGLP